MDSGVLLKLPSDWQVKIRDEMVSKLSLCIDKGQAKTVAEETWEYLSQEKFNKQQLTNKLKTYLLQHASDFTEWLYDFVQKTVEYYHETHLPLNEENLSETQTTLSTAASNTNTSNTNTSNTNISNTNTSGDTFMKTEKVEMLKESRSRLMKNALKDIHSSSDSLKSSKSNNQGAVANETEDKLEAVDKKKKLLDALDQPLDKLILKEKIAKLQGQSVPLGVKTKSEKFKINDTEKHKIDTENFKLTNETYKISNEKYKLSTENFNPKRKKNSFYKNLTLVNDSSGNSEPVETAVNGEEESVKVVKVPKRCINYPNCEFGEKCRYIHPNNVPCKNWPNCFFGTNCAFLHPNQ
ncbi:Zinc finger C-x8-C-x5-C-x3-H type family protein [Theileria parva strain Muguga]|nr:Zinc finger C-x8-C-x5-C-x3-H type family protein [Theileria parva strain Muguga]EAN31572.2 Zinc finger C-x8-C-x5-C-x3-H type family protein [Theileria parva strain Muguga]